MKKIFYFLITAVLLGSCAVQSPLYTWSNYKTALAHFTEKPDNSSRSDLESCLLTIMTESIREKKKVPPGIYLQYGYLMAQEGKKDMAMQYYATEKVNYPEASVIVDELEQKLKQP